MKTHNKTTKTMKRIDAYLLMYFIAMLIVSIIVTA